jgi:hypothetical protein
LFLDVWGPAAVTSVNNNRFYLSVVDDFSKYTWLFPLASKSEVCATFLRFKQLVETFFNTKIKSVQVIMVVNSSHFKNPSIPWESLIG